MRSKDSLEIEKSLRENYKKFKSPEFYFGEDTTQNLKEDWDKSNFKVLCVYLSCGQFRSNSNTYTAINSIIKKYNPNIFVDYCYFPYYEDRNLLDKMNLPYIFGNVSHHIARDYDLVLVNCSVIKEVFNLPIMLSNSDIPLTSNKRVEQNTIPLFVLGGSSASVVHCLFGEGSLVDLALFGLGEDTIPSLLKSLEGVNTKQDKEDVIRKIFENNISGIKNYLYYPNGYEVNYKSNNLFIDNITVKDNWKGIFPNKVAIAHNKNNIIDFNHKILNLDGSFVKHADIRVSTGCTKYGACSFCLEGNTSGSWNEIPLKDIEEDIREIRRNYGCEALGVYSFNSNYYSGIYEVSDIASKYFDRISMLASRADVYSDNLRFLELVKEQGGIKLGIAAEGISDKLRNRYLNKNLTKKQYYQAVKNIMENSFLTLKINFILTGKETVEDFEEWVEDFKYFLELKKQHNYKTRLSITITNLIIYDQTPLRYEKRRMAFESYNYKSSEFISLYSSYLNKLKELGINITIYGTSYVTCVEQLILDLGRKGTKFIIEGALNYGICYNREISRKMGEDFITLCEKEYNLEEVFSERDNDFIFDSDIIDFNDNDVIEEYKVNKTKDDYYKRNCEHGSKEKVKCINCEKVMCARKNGEGKTTDNTHKETNDPNTTDSDSNHDIHSDSCDVKDTIYNNISIISKETDTHDNKQESDDINSEQDDVTVNPCQSGEKRERIIKKQENYLRLLTQRDSRYQYISPIVQSTLLMGDINNLLFSELGEKGLQLIAYEKKNNLDEICGNGLKPYYSGRFITDLYLRESLSEKMVEALEMSLPVINKRYDSFKLMGLMQTNTSMTANDYNIYVGYIDNINPTDFIERYEESFIVQRNPNVICKDVRKSINLMLRRVEIDNSDLRLFYDFKSNKIIIGIIARMGISPYLVIKTLFNKIRLEEIYTLSNFILLGSYKKNGYNLKCRCGKNLLFNNLYTDKLSNLCMECTLKTYMSKI